MLRMDESTMTFAPFANGGLSGYLDDFVGLVRLERQLDQVEALGDNVWGGNRQGKADGVVLGA